MNHPAPPRHPYLRWSTWSVYGLLAALGIPWYWKSEQEVVLLGMPLWALVSLGAGLLASIYTAWLLLRFWPLEDEAS